MKKIEKAKKSFYIYEINHTVPNGADVSNTSKAM